MKSQINKEVIVKMLITLKLIYGISVMSYQNSTSFYDFLFFLVTDNLMLKCIWTRKGPRIFKAILQKTNLEALGWLFLSLTIRLQ